MSRPLFVGKLVAHHVVGSRPMKRRGNASNDLTIIPFALVVLKSQKRPEMLLLLRNLHECLKSRRSYLKFCNFELKLNGCVPLNNVILNFMAVFVVSWTALSIISCISCVDSSPNLPFSSIFFCRRNLASREKFYAERHLPHSFPYKVKRRYNGW